MILAIAIVIASILALAGMLFLLRGSAFGAKFDWRPEQLGPIDVTAFRNLIDPREEDYLRERLSPSEFRRIHRERMLAAADYVRGAARNAGILIRLGEAARHSSDPAVTVAGERLRENALHLRLFALQILPRLYLSVVVTTLRPTPTGVMDRYENLTRQAVMLNCLQAPLRGASHGI